jgi:spermidine/putrescine transport system ATP-binding protein
MSGNVELERITKLYGTFKAVDDVSLAISEGSFVSLLGSSGAGKSTVLRMIGGFEYPDFGRITIGGKDVTMLPPYRRDVNTVFQNFALFPHMSAADNVAYGLRQDGVSSAERRKRVREALDIVEMIGFADRRPMELSGGQQQRIALARALVKRPSVLLLDEPLGALDRKLRQQMQVELKLLQNQLGLTFIFVTHDQEEALAMSDMIAVMRDGRIEQLGTPIELYDRPHTAFVASFIGVHNFIPGERVDHPNFLRSDDGTAFEARGTAAKLPPGSRALGAVRPENVLLSQEEPVNSRNRLRAQVAAAVMLGDALEFVLRLPNGKEFLSRVPRRSAWVPSQGDTVWAHWEPERFTLFPYEELQTRTIQAGRTSAGAKEAQP